MTNIENKILEKCGWSDKQLNFQGVMVHKVSSENNNMIAHIVSKRTENEILIEFSVPDKNGEKINFVFDINSQQINKTKTDKDIAENKDLDNFLEMINSTIHSQKGVFMATKQLELENISESSLKIK